jgi:hypothetical protein
VEVQFSHRHLRFGAAYFCNLFLFKEQMNQSILERKLSGDPQLRDLIQILKRSAELSAEDATMTAKEARCFLRLDRGVWDTYRKQG